MSEERQENGERQEVRVLEIGDHRFTNILVLDEPGEGNACHKYEVVDIEAGGRPFGTVSFQNGPIGEAGLNGLFHEDLLAIVIDRLRSFQKGEYRCRENALALTKIEEAMHWLNHRTKTRQDQGVEGTNQVHNEG